MRGPDKRSLCPAAAKKAWAAAISSAAELLKPLATVAFQTLWKVRENQPAAVDSSGKPRKINSCHTYASDREVVQVRWPMHFDGTPAK